MSKELLVILGFIIININQLCAGNPVAKKLDLKWNSLGNLNMAFQESKGYAALPGSNYHRLLSPMIFLNTVQNNCIELNVKGKVQSSKLYFRNKENKFSERLSVRGKYINGKLRFYCGDNKNWNGIINFLRFDFHTNGETPIVITDIKISKVLVPPYPVLSSRWNSATSLEALKSQSFQCELPDCNPVAYTLRSNIPLLLTVQYFDILHEKLTHHDITLSPDSSGYLPHNRHASTVKFEITNENAQKAVFTLELTQKPKKSVPALKSVDVKMIAIPPKNTDETVYWEPLVRITGLDSKPRNLAIYLVSKELKLMAGEIEVSDFSSEYRFPKLTFRYLNPGNYHLEAELDGIPCKITDYTFKHIGKKEVSLPSVILDTKGMRPHYVINGNEKVDTMEFLFHEGPHSLNHYRQIENAIQAGVKGIRLRVVFRFDQDGKIHFRETDEMMQSILLRHPEINLMLVVSVTDPGPSWRVNHPEEGIRNAQGEYHIRNYREKPEATSSMASRRWMNDSIACIRKLVEHLEAIPGGERVIGIIPCSGITWEWLNWDSARGEMVDYSEHFRQVFIGMMCQKYGNDIKTLNSAWNSSFKDFTEIKIPSPALRNNRPNSDFLTGPQNRYIADYIDSISLLTSQNIETLCQVIKEASGGRLLTGTYYGYSNYIVGVGRSQDAGHNQLARLLNSKWIDFFLAPSRYAGRELGGAGGFMYPESSILLHGKGIISECDVRPFSSDNKTGKTYTHRSSRAVIEREFGMQLARHGTMRWFDFSKGWITEEPRLLDLTKKISAYEHSLANENTILWKNADTVAVYTAEGTSAWMTRGSRLFHILLEENYRQLTLSGISFNMYLTSDMVHVPEEHRMSIFLNAQYLSKAEKDFILNKLCKPGKTIIFCHGIGICGNENLDISFMEQLFRCKFEISEGRRIRTMKLTPEGSMRFGMNMDREIASSQILGPVFYPVGKFTVLAKNPDGGTAAMETRYNGCSLIFLSHPNLNWKWIYSIAKKAGLPAALTNGQPAWIGNDFAVFHSKKGEKITLILPESAIGIQDWLTGKFIPSGKNEINLNLLPESTRIFKVIYK